MIFLDDYFESIEYVPIELRQGFTSIRELDLQVHNAMDSLGKNFKEFFDKVHTLTPQQKQDQYSNLLVKCDEVMTAASDKVRVADSLHELIEKCRRHLDIGLEKLREDLKDGDKADIIEELERRSKEEDDLYQQQQEQMIAQQKQLQKQLQQKQQQQLALSQTSSRAQNNTTTTKNTTSYKNLLKSSQSLRKADARRQSCHHIITSSETEVTNVNKLAIGDQQLLRNSQNTSVTNLEQQQQQPLGRQSSLACNRATAANNNNIDSGPVTTEQQNSIQQQITPQCTTPIVVVGNKTGVDPDPSKVFREQVEPAVTQDWGVSLVDCPTKEDTNINLVFQELQARARQKLSDIVISNNQQRRQSLPGHEVLSNQHASSKAYMMNSSMIHGQTNLVQNSPSSAAHLHCHDPIVAAASQAINATQQMQHGRRTSSLKASYAAVNSGGLQNISSGLLAPSQQQSHQHHHNLQQQQKDGSPNTNNPLSTFNYHPYNQETLNHQAYMMNSSMIHGQTNLENNRVPPLHISLKGPRAIKKLKQQQETSPNGGVYTFEDVEGDSSSHSQLFSSALGSPRTPKQTTFDVRQPVSMNMNHHLMGDNNQRMMIHNHQGSGGIIMYDGVGGGSGLIPSNEVYCYCRKIVLGADMIGCDNPDCSIEWFHYECVGITTPPEGKWYCDACKADLACRSQ